MSQPVLSIREMNKELVYAQSMLKSVTTTDPQQVGLTPVEAKAILESYIELIVLSKERLEMYRDLKAKFDRMASCR